MTTLNADLRELVNAAGYLATNAGRFAPVAAEHTATGQRVDDEDLYPRVEAALAAVRVAYAGHGDTLYTVAAAAGRLLRAARAGQPEYILHEHVGEISQEARYLQEEYDADPPIETAGG